MFEAIDDLIDIPFNFRHICWFCGEPAAHYVSFPNDASLTLACYHSSLTLMACHECKKISKSVSANSIWQFKEQIKRQLMKIYHQHLAIGLNWTEAELINSQFEGGNFAEFQRSAWFMYQVAKNRVNFAGWPLSKNGVLLENNDVDLAFSFDGVIYPTINDAILHYVKTYQLSQDLFVYVLTLLGKEQFAAAVRFCRLLVGATANERQQALTQLLANNP